MRKSGIGVGVLTLLMWANLAIASQEIKGVTVYEYKMNFVDQVCTITIDQDVPTSEATKNCTQRKFSWKCLIDDYLWKMLLHIEQNNLHIDIRYSSAGCFDEKSGNFELLTVW